MCANTITVTPQQAQQQQQQRRRHLWRRANSFLPIVCLLLLMLQLATATKPKIAVDPTGEEEDELNTVGQLSTNGVQTGVVANPTHVTSATMNQGKNAKLVTTSSTPSLASTTTNAGSGIAAAGTLGAAGTNSAAPLVQQQAPALQGTFTAAGATPAVPATPLVAAQPAKPAATAASAGHSLGGTFKAVSGSGRRLRGVAAIQD